MLGGEVVEREQGVAILGQAARGLVVLGLVLGEETIERRRGVGSARGLVDRVEIGLGLGLHGFRQVVEHVRRLMDPAALRAHGRPDLPRGLPEAQRTVAGGEFGVEGEAVLIPQADQQLMPALLARAEAVGDRPDRLLAASIGADQDQHALAGVLEPRRAVDPVRPDVHVPLGREIAFLPALVLLLPSAHQATDGGRRQARRVRTQQDRECVLELTRGDALQVKPGQQLLDVPGAAQVGRQHRRGEADAGGVAGTPVAHPRPLHLNAADAGLDAALRCVAVADQAATSALVDLIGMHRKEGCHLGLDRVGQHLPRSFTQHGEQRVVFDRPSWPRQPDNGILLHGVSSHR